MQDSDRKEKLKLELISAVDTILEGVDIDSCERCKIASDKLRILIRDAPKDCDLNELIDLLPDSTNKLSPALINTQQPSQIKETEKVINHLQNELIQVRMQRDKYKEELELKSKEWKNIKDKLRQRQSIKNILGNALNDSEQENEDPRTIEEERQDVVDLSQDSQKTSYHEVTISSYEDTQLPENIFVNENILPDRTDLNESKRANEHDEDCPCCSKFYKAVCVNPSELSERIKTVSRHNYRQNMPNTPPGFWNVGFTQEK